MLSATAYGGPVYDVVVTNGEFKLLRKQTVVASEEYALQYTTDFEDRPQLRAARDLGKSYASLTVKHDGFILSQRWWAPRSEDGEVYYFELSYSNEEGARVVINTFYSDGLYGVYSIHSNNVLSLIDEVPMTKALIHHTFRAVDPSFTWQLTPALIARYGLGQAALAEPTGSAALLGELSHQNWRIREAAEKRIRQMTPQEAAWLYAKMLDGGMDINAITAVERHIPLPRLSQNKRRSGDYHIHTPAIRP